MKTLAPSPTGIRFTPEDRRIIQALRRKLGVKPSEIVRLAIRKLAEIERVGEAEPPPLPPQYDAFVNTRGIARDVFRSLGGGEAFIRAERAAFAAAVLARWRKGRKRNEPHLLGHDAVRVLDRGPSCLPPTHIPGAFTDAGPRRQFVHERFYFGRNARRALTGRNKDEIADRIRPFFRSPDISVLPFTAATADHYGRIRAKLRVSPADAIHLACAAEAEADLFLTNDASLVGKIVPASSLSPGCRRTCYGIAVRTALTARPRILRYRASHAHQCRTSHTNARISNMWMAKDETWNTTNDPPR